jgi:hypothetical protein
MTYAQNPITPLKTKLAISTVALTSLGIMKSGINLTWHYEKGYVNLSMPKHVMKQLAHYALPAPVKPQHCPFSPNPIPYSKDN